MTVEAALLAVLGPLVDGRAYPDVAADKAPLPYITFQQVGGQPVNFLAGVPGKRNGRFQINTWSSNRIEASALIRQIEDAVRTDATLNATTETGAVSTHEPETNIYGARQDFSIWF